MPPHTKITKEAILKEAFSLVKAEGIEVLNARLLAKRLGCSTQPIFRHFTNMEDLKHQVKLKIDETYQDFIQKYLDQENQLFTISLAYIEFARVEKNLFGALFISPLVEKRTMKQIVTSPWNLDSIACCERQYHLSRSQAEQLYRDVRFYSHGIATQLYAGMVILTKEETEELVANAIHSFIPKGTHEQL